MTRGKTRSSASPLRTSASVCTSFMPRKAARPTSGSNCPRARISRSAHRSPARPRGIRPGPFEPAALDSLRRRTGDRRRPIALDRPHWRGPVSGAAGPSLVCDPPARPALAGDPLRSGYLDRPGVSRFRALALRLRQSPLLPPRPCRSIRTCGGSSAPSAASTWPRST